MKKNLHLPFIIFQILFIFLNNISIRAQAYAEMNFQGYTLESGTFGQDGSTYRFDKICGNIDAVIKITGRSGPSVSLSSIDTSGPGLGYAKAFQPVVGIPGTAPANSSWWMDFQLSFYQTGTFTPVTATEFYGTGIDIDGDGLTINEWSIMRKIESIDSAVVNNLTFTLLGPYFQGYDYRVDGIIANSPGIDTSAHNVMATYRYTNKSSIDFRIGANTAGSTSTAAMRLNSIWFKQMYAGVPLPIKLTSFTVVLNNDKTELNWSVESEANMSHYVIERSIDGQNFTDVAIIFANEISSEKANYNYKDELKNMQPGNYYYRLCLVDNNRKSQYSETRIIRISKQAETAKITTYPNPVTSLVNVEIPVNWQNQKVTYELINANGQVTKRTESASGSQTEAINISNVAPGFYIMKVSCEGQTAQQKIIKQ